MTTDLTDTRRRIEMLRTQLQTAEAQLELGERQCPHNRSSEYWSDPQQTFAEKTTYEPDMTRPSAQGVHLDYPTRPVTRQVPLWQRTCRLCGKVETTEKTRPVTQQVPAF